jgi:APA family basic amino acid/polyamine antiporter
MNQSDSELRRELTLFDATLIGVGSMVGSGIFLDVPGMVASSVGGSMLALGVWVAGGAVSLVGALCISELASRMPQAGGQFVYLRAGLGPLSAFLYGWASLLVIQTNAIAAVALAFATYLTPFIPLPGYALKLVAIGAILVLTLANRRSLRAGADTQNFFSLAKGLALAGLVLLCLWPHGDWQASLQPFWPGEWRASLAGSFGSALVGALWAYDGWICIAMVAGEVKLPAKNLPRALLLSTGIVAGLYTLVNLGYFRILSFPAALNTRLVAADAAQIAFPHWGRQLFAATVVVATFGTASAFILSCPRIYYAMAREGLFFRFLGNVHSRYRTPAAAILLQGAIAALLTLTGGYIRLFSNAMFAEFLFYGLSVVALMNLRRRQPAPIDSRLDGSGGYRVGLYPWLPMAFLAFSVWFVINMLIQDFRGTWPVAVLTAAGIPVYWAWKRSGGLQS